MYESRIDVVFRKITNLCQDMVSYPDTLMSVIQPPSVHIFNKKRI